jgi:CysZ protein
MNDIRILPLSIRLITRDPVNLLLAVIPTVLALLIYLLGIYFAFRNYDTFVAGLGGYFGQETAGFLGKLLTAVLIIFLFLLMSWTFVIVVGIIAAPFNSMLSERIEHKLSGRPVEQKASRTFGQIAADLGTTFKNELKKVIFLGLMGILAFVLNLFPIFYPVGLFLVASLLAAQFVDYSWSRHDLDFGQCLKDMMVNALPYSLSGFLFLLLVTVPLVNAFVPALATSYFTVLWLKRQQRLGPEAQRLLQDP